MPYLEDFEKNALIENMRIMFDGMRAYHDSEIHHVNHAITMLLAIAGAAGTVIVTLLFNPGNITTIKLKEIAWGLHIVISTFSFLIAFTTHIKINHDHNIYENFGREYVKTCIFLGLYDKKVRFNFELENIKIDKTIGQGRGYTISQNIVWAFAVALIFFTGFFAACYKL